MKVVLLFLCATLSIQLVHANNIKKTIIRDESYDIEINLNDQVVGCAVSVFSFIPLLNLVVPGIEYYTSLNHVSTLQAGRCNIGMYDDTRIPLLVNSAKPTEKVTVRVMQSEIKEAFVASQVCNHYYLEEVSTIVRGIAFAQSAATQLSSIGFKNCLN